MNTRNRTIAAALLTLAVAACAKQGTTEGTAGNTVTAGNEVVSEDANAADGGFNLSDNAVDALDNTTAASPAANVGDAGSR